MNVAFAVINADKRHQRRSILLALQNTAKEVIDETADLSYFLHIKKYKRGPSMQSHEK
jgi:hypothetical protein